MADINAESLDTVNRTLSTRFQEGLASTPNMGFLALITMFTSMSRSNFYAWLKRNLSVREFDGARVFNDLESEDFEVTNKEFELSASIKERDIKDDNMGLYDKIFFMMGQSWQRFKLKKTTNVLVDNEVAFTGLSINNDSHLYGTNTIDNLVTTALSKTALDAADAAAGGFKMEDDDPTGTLWDTLIVGPTLRHLAWDLVKNRNAAVDSVHAENFFESERKMNLVVNPYLTANSGVDNDVDAEHFWYLMDTSLAIGSVALQIREDVSMLVDLDPATVKRTKKLDYMSDSTLEAFPAFPHLVYGSRATS